MRLLPLSLILALLAGCATSDGGRRQLVAPDAVSAVYSGIDMQARLLLVGERDCSPAPCADVDDFRRRVSATGAQLSAAAYVAYPDLERRVSRFEFIVPDKKQLGAVSNSGGTVAIYAGLSEMDIDAPALNFILAREMGHVIARHHEENSALSILVSIAAQLLLPVANIIRGAAAAIPLTTTVAATTTAASVVGSRILKAVNRPDQLDEADAVAIRLLKQSGHDLQDVARSAEALMPRLARVGEEGWVAEFRLSKGRLDQFDCGASGLPPQGRESLAAAFAAGDPVFAAGDPEIAPLPR